MRQIIHIAMTALLLLSLLGAAYAAAFATDQIAGSEAGRETESVAGGGGGLPSAHMIAVPWHQQMNGLFCGEGVLESVYDYWGPDIDQKQIADVARSSSAGTWTADMVRAGHFSNKSAAYGRFFPGAIPRAGYSERAIGYASFSHSSDEFWLEELKGLISKGIPVILLMTFEPDGGGGHYRTAIGYDDSLSMVYFSDPWGRDLKHQTNWTGITSWTYDELESGWNYTAAGEDHPYWGMIMMPWQIDLDISGRLRPGGGAAVSAEVTYPCPQPFNSSQFPAREARAVITLAEGMRLVSGSNTLTLGEMGAGSSKRASWRVAFDGSVTGKEIRVKAYGNVSGQVPEARWTGEQKFYPPYNYSDYIGGEAALAL
jgi:hypothetical protein